MADLSSVRAEVKFLDALLRERAQGSSVIVGRAALVADKSLLQGCWSS